MALEVGARPDSANEGPRQASDTDTLAAGRVATRSRLAERLRPGASVGRYTILERLGAGGMGVVYAAFDPDLDRRIAIKLMLSVHSEDTDREMRLLREAQALARLSHPHVVAVHDVGTLGRDVWIAMEYVKGRTLKQWLEEAPRTIPDVLGVMLAAGQGVAAAHAAGLVHRDLKPDNIMVGSDGRPRIMDFGLAREAALLTTSPAVPETDRVSSSGAFTAELTRAGAVMGTPAYMAPEQHEGLAADARADQFSFCVTSWEALYRQRPFDGDTLPALTLAVLQGNITPPPRTSKVPVHVRRALERGLAVSADSRWPEMESLLAELIRDPFATRRRMFAGVGMAAVVGLGWGGWELRLAGLRDDCADESTEIARAWAQRRDVVATGFSAGESSFRNETWKRVEPRLERWIATWQASREEACLGYAVDRQIDEKTHEGIIRCLDAQAGAFEELLTLFETADLPVVQLAVRAVTGVGDPPSCEARPWTASVEAEPQSQPLAAQLRRRLARARGLELAGRYAEGLMAAQDVAAQAKDAGLSQLEIEALFRSGVLAGHTGALKDSETWLTDAYFRAGEAGIDTLSADIALELTDLVGGTLERLDEGLLWSRNARMLLVRLDDLDGLRAAELDSIMGAIHHGRGEYARAHELYQRSLDAKERLLGSDHPELAFELSSLAMLYQIERDLDRAEMMHRRALEVTISILGPEHPHAAASLLNLGVVAQRRGELDRAEEHYRSSIRILERSSGPNDAALGTPLNNLAGISEMRGDLEGALALRERVLALFEATYGQESSSVAFALTGIALVHLKMDELDRAQELYERAIAIVEKSLGVDHVDLKEPVCGLAAVHERRERFAQAHTAYERCLAIGERVYGPDHPQLFFAVLGVGDTRLAQDDFAAALPYLERAVKLADAPESEATDGALARLSLAHALHGLGAQRDRVRQLAMEARTIFAEAKDPEGVAEADEFLADQR